MNADIGSVSGYCEQSADRTVSVRRLLPGPVERVWAYLTDSELRRQWLAAGDLPNKVGEAFELVWRNHELSDPAGRPPDGYPEENRLTSTLIEYDAPRRLAFTWGSGDVVIDLEPRGQQVLLTLVHRGIADRNSLLSFSAGWHMHLDILGAKLTNSAALPFWSGFRRLFGEYEDRIQ